MKAIEDVCGYNIDIHDLVIIPKDMHKHKRHTGTVWMWSECTHNMSRKML